MEDFAKVNYEYKEETNTVVATINSIVELQSTKKSWSLSENKKQYTYEFNSNTTYTTTVTDIMGRTKNVVIKIDQIDDKPPQIDMEYVLNNDNTIKVIMHSDEILEDTKPSWNLSENKLDYVKIYTFDNQEYATPVQDIWGNEVWIKIKMKTKSYYYENAQGPNLTVKYIYDSNDIVTAYIISDRKLTDSKPSWNLDESQTIYKKVFTSNNSYLTDVIDEQGNKVYVSVIINFFKNTYLGIDVSEFQKFINWSSVKNSGIDFAFIRVGYRGWGTAGTLVKDRFFETNIIEATKVRNRYWFLFL